MSSPKLLLDTEDRWPTEMGGLFPGERVVFRGKDLFSELGRMRWMELLLFGITGRRFSDQEIRLFEGIWVLCTSYPEPRIWNNRVASLCGSARSTSAFALAAGTAISEARVYGGQPLVGAFNLLKRVKYRRSLGETLSNILSKELEKRPIPGYGRPIVNGDERIEPLATLAESLGLAEGPYFKLCFEIEKELINIAQMRHKHWPVKMNVGALMSSLVADRQFSAHEYHQFITLCFTGGMFPCFSEAAQRPAGTFLPLRCDRIAYQGPGRRRWHAATGD